MWTEVVPPPLPSCVTLGKSLDLCQHPDGTNNTFQDPCREVAVRVFILFIPVLANQQELGKC